MQWYWGPTIAQAATSVAGETTIYPPIVIPVPKEAVEVDVATIVTVEVGIAKTMDAIGTNETVTTEIITAIIGIMVGAMMISM